MAVHPIRYLPDPVLREKAKRVPRIDAAIHRLIDDMIDTMHAAHGVGLAAPQIGISLKLVVIGIPGEEPFALINPEIVKVTGERTVEEGCLSIPGYRAELTRHKTVVAKALSQEGKEIRIKSKDDLLAQALEHEIDHINGILYIDHLPDLEALVKVDESEYSREPAG